MTDLEISNGITGVITDKLKFETKALILATGHSARDVYELLQKNIELEQKPFAVGIRLEIPQDQINTARYRNLRITPVESRLPSNLRGYRKLIADLATLFACVPAAE